MRAFLKRLEIFGKSLLATVLGVVLRRPGQLQRAISRLASVERILLVRMDNRVGEAVLMTPLFATLKRHHPRASLHVLVHPRVARVHQGHPLVDRVIALDGKRLLRGESLGLIRALRRADYDVVVDCGNWTAPSVTNAIVSRLVGPRSAVLGPAAAPVGPLHTHPVVARPDTARESLQRLHLLSPLVGDDIDDVLSQRPVAASDALRAFLDARRERSLAVLYPGGRLAYRRVPTAGFIAACRVLIEAGREPIVAWGPGEEAVAREVVDAVPGAVLAPPTSLDDLAALIAHAGLTVCNNTGPMHLSVALGVPTFQLFRFMDPERWGHPHPPHRVVDITAVAEDDEALRGQVESELRKWIEEETSERVRTTA